MAIKHDWEKNSSYKTIKEVVSANMGVPDADTAIKGWKEKYEKKSYSIVGLMRACMKIHIYRSGKIRIIGDYDVDGKCAVAILYRVLKKIGIENVSYRIPRPMSEGYGMNMSIVDETEPGTLVITVDNGIAALEEVKKLKELGIDVIVTDHHLPKTEEDGTPILPDTDIVIDPKAEDMTADFDGYCGAGLAYRLALRLLQNEHVKDPAFEHELQTLASIATVCDSVPLREENYWIVKDGLKYLSDGTTFAGVKALLEVFSLAGHVTETDIGYKIGPAINADNRIYDDATVAIDLLLEDDSEKAVELAGKLKEINDLRKSLVKEATAFSEKIVSNYKMENDFPIFVNLGKNVKERLVGIIAGKIAEEYHAPAVCFAETDSDIFKGSARSVTGVDIHDILNQAASCFITFGGHKAACGLSLTGRDKYLSMKEITQRYVEKEDLRPPLELTKKWDIQVGYNQVEETIKILTHYAPYGEGNPMPVVKVVGFSAVPKNGFYFKTMSYEGVKFCSKEGIEAVGFGFSEILEGKKPKEIVLYGTLGENYFKGRITPQISFEDMEVLSEHQSAFAYKNPI